MERENYLIVGGSYGVGLAVVKTLRERGASVRVLARSEGELKGLSDVQYRKFDVLHDSLDMEYLPRELDGLLYCPGTINLKRFERLTDSDFSTDFEINVLGAVRTIRSCLELLRKSQQGAAIVLISSVAAGTGMPLHASVAATKGAVEGLVRSLAAEFAPRIRVNAVAPSLTDTRLSQMLIATESKRIAAEKRHPLKRIGVAQDIANAAAFLLSSQSSWITGQILHVDGGLSSIRLFEHG